jgi:hypothetical protein
MRNAGVERGERCWSRRGGADLRNNYTTPARIELGWLYDDHVGNGVGVSARIAMGVELRHLQG